MKTEQKFPDNNQRVDGHNFHIWANNLCLLEPFIRERRFLDPRDVTIENTVGKGVNPLPDDKSLALSKLKVFADKKLTLSLPNE